MKCEIIKQESQRIPRSFICHCLNFYAQCLRKRKGMPLHLSTVVSVVFLESQEMKKLNQLYRKKNKVTDVLSFNQDEGNYLGDIVLSLKIVRQQALDHDLSLKEELSYLLLHGLLHLLGYDHEKSDREAKKMFQLQDSLWNEYGKKYKL